jgi:hypothetical protein
VKVLDVYTGQENVLEAQFPGAVVTHVNIKDILNPLVLQLTSEFDAVYCTHALTTMARDQVTAAVDWLKARTRQGGELWVITPSAEWAAGQVLSQEPNPLSQMVLFGFEGQNHSMYTLLWLRALLESAGMITRRAFQGPWKVNINGADIELPQNVVIAMRYDDPIPEPIPVTANALV